MKVLNKTLVAASIASAVLATGAAQAATITNFPSTAAAPAPYAETLVNEAVLTDVDVQLLASVNEFELVLGAGEALAEDDSITLTLTNGATWEVISASSLLDDGAAAAVALVSGGVGSSEAVFRVTAAGIAATSVIALDDGTVATMTQVDLSATPANGAVGITASMSGFVGGVATALYGSPLTYNAYQLAPMMTASTTTGSGATNTGIFDVATGFTTLTGTATPPSTSGSATIDIDVNANAVLGVAGAAGVAAGVPGGAPLPASTLVTINGPMTGVSAITAANVAGATAAGAASTPAVAGGFSIDTANNAAYGTTVANADVVFTLTFDGTTSYDASSYTADVTRIADGNGYSATTVATGLSALSFTRNGSTFATNSFGPLNKMTVTDRSGALGSGGADGAIGITAFAADGTAVTCTGLSIDNLPNNGTVTIQGADVLAACPDAKRIEGLVNSTSIQTTNTKVTSDGATNQSGLNVGATISN